MISRFFNYASAHPVKTALSGVGIVLATPFLLPYLGASLIAPVTTLAALFSVAAMGTGTAYAGAHAVRGAHANAGKIALGGLGTAMAMPYVAPFLGVLSAPAVALAGAFAPAAMLVGAGFLAVRLATPLFKSRAPQPA